MATEQGTIHAANQSLIQDVLQIIHRIAPGEVQTLLDRDERLLEYWRADPAHADALRVVELRAELLREVLAPPAEEP